MWIWVTAVGFVLLAIDAIGRECVGPISRLFAAHSETSRLRVALEGVECLRVQLESGSIPEVSDWSTPFLELKLWANTVPALLQKLRASGLPVLPTLRSLRDLLAEELAGLRQARLKSAQARFQAVACLFLVPILGLALTQLLDGPAQNAKLWCAIVLSASFMGVLAAVWMDHLARKAVRHGLSPENAILAQAAPLAFARFQAELRSGSPPDLAWQAMLADTEDWHTEFRALWSPIQSGGISSGGISNVSSRATEQLSGARAVRILLGATASQVRDAVRASLFEGRPCGERIEVLGTELRRDLEAIRARELELLASRALQPLFICVAPAVLGIVGAALAFEAAGALRG